MRAALPSAPLLPHLLTAFLAPCPAYRSVFSTTFDHSLSVRVVGPTHSPPAVTLRFEFRSPIELQDIGGIDAAR